MIKNANEERLYEYIGGIIRGLGGILLIINGVEDHVHILARLRPDKAVSDALRDLKSNASGWMHDVFPDAKDLSWQNGHGSVLLGPTEIERIKRCIPLTRLLIQRNVSEIPTNRFEANTVLRQRVI